jgi:damage-control phosphatase, subfamily I
VHTALDCIPCFTRQALGALRCAGTAEAAQREVMRHVLRALAAEVDLGSSPPEIAQRVHRLVRRLTGDGDPYASLKARANAIALAAEPLLRESVEAARDRFAAATRLAIAANALDAGISTAAAVGGEHAGGGSQGAAGRLVRDLRRGLEEPLHGDLEEFRGAVARAKRIVYLTDNSGEIVVDGLLVEQLPHDRVVVAVRGAPVLNDATLADARAAGLDALASVIENGSDAPGTVLSDCSPEFRRVFGAADVIIAKGQGNYESLSDVDAPVFFLLKVKCPLAARHAGLPLGAHALLRPSVAARA